MALFLLIHVVAGAVAAAAAVAAVPLNLPRLLLLVFVVVGVVGVVGGGGSDTPLMARSLAANECQVTRVAPAAAAAAAATAAAGAAAETSANLTFHLECVSEKWGKITKLVKHSLISSMINIARAARVKGRNKVIRL